MADIRITDLVDPKAIEDLRTVKTEVDNVRTAYLDAAKMMVEAIKIKVEVVGDIDKINNLVAGGMKKAEEATVQLNMAVEQQRQIIGQTTNVISRELAEIEKENKAKRAAFNQDKSMLDVAKSIIGTRDENIERLIKEQKRMKDLKDEQKQLDDAVKKGAMTEQQAYERRVEIESQYRQTKASVQELTRVLNNQDKELNAADGSYQQLSLQLEQLKMAYKQMTDEEKNNPMGKAMNEEIQKMDAHLKDLAADMGEYQRNVGNYAIAAGNYVDVMLNAVGVNGQFGNSLRSLVSEGGGDLLGGMNMKLKALGATLKGFLANPAILAILGIGGTIAAFKWWYDYNKGLMDATRLTREFLGLTGDELVDVRSEIQAVADEWGKDYKDVLSAIDILMNQYGIDSREALDIVRGGFQAGADLSGNMLSNMERYAPIFKDMKLDGSELAAVLAQTRSGIFNEQGLQMMQMATKRLGEMSSGTKKALEDLGISTDEWNKKLLNGEANFFDYLQEVSRKIGELPRESQEVSNAFKEVFGRNGAAGGMELVKYLGEMTTNLEEVKKVTGEVGELHDQHIEKMKELNTKVAELFDFTQDGFEEATLATKNYVTDALIYVVDYLQKAVNWSKEWYDQNIVIRAAAESVGIVFQYMFKGIQTGIKNAMAGFEGFARTLKSLTDFDQSPEKYFNNYLKIQKDTLNKMKNNSMDFFGDMKQATAAAMGNIENGRSRGGSSSSPSSVSLEENGDGLSGGGDDDDDNDNDNKTTVSPSKTAEAKNMEEVREIIMEATRKTIEDRLKLVEEGSEEEMKLSAQYAEAEMAAAVAAARKNFDKQKGELDASLAQRKISQEEYAKGIEVLNEEMMAAELAAEHEKNEAISEARKKFSNAEIGRISEFYAVQKSLRDTAYVEEVTAIEQEYAEGLITKEEYERSMYDAKVRYEQASALAVIESMEKQLDVEEMTDKDREKAMRELAKAKADLAKKEADETIAAMEREKKADDDLAKKRQQNMRKWMQTASQAIGKIKGLMDAMYDGKIQKLDEEKEANQAHYDEEIERIESLAERGAISTEEAEARKAAAEKRRSDKEAELEKKKQEIEYKKAVWEKATAVAQTGIATALGIMQAMATMPPNPVLAGVIAAMGAVQVANILATPIKAYAKGTGEKGHDGGLAMVGDGGKREVVVIGNSAWLTPDKPVVVDLPKGAMVYPDVDDWKLNVPLFGKGMALQQNEPKTLVVNDYKRLEKKMDERNRLARISLRLQADAAYRAEFAQYRRER